ncbi:DUF3558 domain-containing protein [Streptomyces sp. NBC_00091]|uniref:DUF3558 domain-containing protein n=1 Tax=Streptomyces sp. NBC_00091 TaxID=2975648 RepID=UPI0022570772|nr:DUF3558 domain-containing protein [Streptomyces sp. NBC_00091]MCX5377743.1 DUF3558 domain-containing protein [Streptomyces sp. NBC_00091]
MERRPVRRRVLPGIAMVTALAAGVTGLAGCTDGNGIGISSDQKGSGSTAAPAQPGKYRILPQPCKAADPKRLKAMLPATDSLTTEQREQLYAGTADASYDGDRHVGCRWNAQAPEGNLLLSVTFERVVSYDRAAASDDDKAHQVYVRRLTDAHLPFPGPATSPSPGAGGSASTSPSAAPGGGGGSGAPSPAASAPASGSASASVSAPPSPTAPPELGSRVLEGLGNEAYIDDKLSAAGATAAQARTVRIVFRTSNVLVTVEYSVQPSAPGTVPSSAETQDKARQLAQALVERFNE